MEFVADTLDDLLKNTIEGILANGEKVAASRGMTKELRSVTLHLSNPRARLSHSEVKGKIFSALGELAWYLSADNSLEFIAEYIARYRKDAEEDGTIHGAYGPRIFAADWHCQFDNVVRLLTERPTTRRAVIQLFDARDIATIYKDVPCTIALQFLIREERLHMIVAMRSNDAFWGLPHDIFSFTMIQELLATTLGKGLGTYSHFASSLHLYDTVEQQVNDFIDEGFQGTVGAEMPPMPSGDQSVALAKFLDAEKSLRSDCCATLNIHELDPYWQDLVRLLQVFHLSKCGRLAEIASIRGAMGSPVYREFIATRTNSKT